MERSEARGYVVAIAVTTFTGAWAAVAGQAPDWTAPAATARTVAANPQLRAVERREAAVRARAVRVNRVLAARRASYAQRLQARLAESARIRSIPAWSSTASSSGPVSIALPVALAPSAGAPATPSRSS